MSSTNAESFRKVSLKNRMILFQIFFFYCRVFTLQYNTLIWLLLWLRAEIDLNQLIILTLCHQNICTYAYCWMSKGFIFGHCQSLYLLIYLQAKWLCSSIFPWCLILEKQGSRIFGNIWKQPMNGLNLDGKHNFKCSHVTCTSRVKLSHSVWPWIDWWKRSLMCWQPAGFRPSHQPRCVGSFHQWSPRLRPCRWLPPANSHSV